MIADRKLQAPATWRGRRRETPSPTKIKTSAQGIISKPTLESMPGERCVSSLSYRNNEADARKHDKRTARVQSVRPNKSRHTLKVWKENVVYPACPSRTPEGIAAEARHAFVPQSDKHSSETRQGDTTLLSLQKGESTQTMTGENKAKSSSHEGDKRQYPETHIDSQSSTPTQIRSPKRQSTSTSRAFTAWPSSECLMAQGQVQQLSWCPSKAGSIKLQNVTNGYNVGQRPDRHGPNTR